MSGLSFVLMLVAGTALADTTFEFEGGNLKVPYPLSFDTGKARLKPESGEAIAYVKAYLDAKTYISSMRIEGHTDSQEAEASNQALSEKRASAVAAALVGKGVDCRRLVPVGFGSTKQIAAPAGHAMNSRIVFVNAGLGGRPIGGMPVDGGGKLAGDPCK